MLKEQVLTYESYWELIPKDDKKPAAPIFWARNIVTGQFLQFNDFRVEIEPKEIEREGDFLNRSLVNLICSP